MARSYREPWYVHGYKGSKKKRYFKRYANKITRKSEEIADGGAHRKGPMSYHICDFRYPAEMRPYVLHGPNGPMLVQPTKLWQVTRK